MSHRRFVLMRDEDVTGVSGTGVVAEGVHWTEADVVALRWTSAWPTSVVFHERGIASVEAVHGHGGKTRIVWLDSAEPLPAPDGRTEGQAVVEVPRELLEGAIQAFRTTREYVGEGLLPEQQGWAW